MAYILTWCSLFIVPQQERSTLSVFSLKVPVHLALSATVLQMTSKTPSTVLRVQKLLDQRQYTDRKLHDGFLRKQGLCTINFSFNG